MRKVLLSAVLTFSACMSLSACGQSAIDKAEDQFVSGCEQGGADASACTCVFDKMEDKYGKDQMLSVAQSGWNRVPPDFGQSMARAVLQCRQS